MKEMDVLCFKLCVCTIRITKYKIFGTHYVNLKIISCKVKGLSNFKGKPIDGATGR